MQSLPKVLQSGLHATRMIYLTRIDCVGIPQHDAEKRHNSLFITFSPRSVPNLSHEATVTITCGMLGSREAPGFEGVFDDFIARSPTVLCQLFREQRLGHHTKGFPNFLPFWNLLWRWLGANSSAKGSTSRALALGLNWLEFELHCEAIPPVPQVVCLMKMGLAIPVTSRGDLLSSEASRIPHCLGSRLTVNCEILATVAVLTVQFVPHRKHTPSP
jgi:hypothetical protein